MPKPKIYLGRSNACNPSDVDNVKRILSGMDCEIVEFTGGVYSKDDVLECDILLLVPHQVQSEAPENAFCVGRGQYYQIANFRNKNSSLLFDGRSPRQNVFIISEIGIQCLYLDEITDLEIHDDTDYKIHWGNAWTNQAQINMESYGINKKKIVYPDFPDLSCFNDEERHQHAWKDKNTGLYYTCWHNTWIELLQGESYVESWERLSKLDGDNKEYKDQPACAIVGNGDDVNSPKIRRAAFGLIPK